MSAASNPDRSPLADLEDRLSRLRRSSGGELAWVLLITIAAAVHASAVYTAAAAPEQTDFAAFVLNARGWLVGTPYPPGTPDPNVPHVILVFAAFSWVPIPVGLALWMMLSYVAAGLAVLRLVRELPTRPSPGVLLTGCAILAASPPVLIVAATGNMIWPLWWAMTAAWSLARRGQRTTSAALLGLLITTKPFLGVWLLYYAWRREWTSLAVASTAAAVTFLFSVLVTGVATWEAWFDVLGRMPWYELRYNASIMGAIARAARPDPLIWAGACTLIATITAVQLSRRRTDVDRDWALLALISVLMAPLGWRYYLTFSLGPLVLCWLTGRLNRAAVVLLAIVGFMPVPAISGGPFVQATAGSAMLWVLVGAWIAVGVDRSSVRSRRDLDPDD